MDGCVGFLPHSKDTGCGATIVTESGFANWRSFSTPRQLVSGAGFPSPPREQWMGVGFLPHSNDTGFGASIVTESGFANWRSFSTPRQLTVGEWFSMGPKGLTFPRLPLSTDSERVVFNGS